MGPPLADSVTCDNTKHGVILAELNAALFVYLERTPHAVHYTLLIKYIIIFYDSIPSSNILSLVRPPHKMRIRTDTRPFII